MEVMQKIQWSQENFLLCKNIKEIWKIMDNPVDKNNLNEYKDMKRVFEKSVVASHDLKANSILKKKRHCI